MCFKACEKDVSCKWFLQRGLLMIGFEPLTTPDKSLLKKISFRGAALIIHIVIIIQGLLPKNKTFSASDKNSLEKVRTAFRLADPVAFAAACEDKK